MDTQKIGKVKLIRDFFAPVTMDEMKSLTAEDKVQLASAIAREKNLTAEQIDFELVHY